MTPGEDKNAAFRHVRRVLHAPEEFVDAVSGAKLLADFLKPGSTPTRIEQFQSPRWAIDFHEAHVKARITASLPQAWASVGVLRSHSPSSWYGHGSRQGMVLCNSPGQPIDGWISPGFSGLTVSVPVAVWDQCVALAGAEPSAISAFSASHLPSPLFERIEHRLKSLRSLLRRASFMPQLAAAAADEAADFALQLTTITLELASAARPSRDSFANRARLARRTEAWMRDHLSAKLSIPEVCLAMRVSRRELEYAFRANFDQSPLDFLHSLRLNAIRRALRRKASSGDPVIRAAFDHGITHLGRFAAQYQALFGEKPSLTVRG